MGDPEIDVDILVDDERWNALALDDIAARIVTALRAELGEQTPAGEISALFADDAELQRLNNSFRSQDKPTNVLSFPAGDMGLPDGVPRPLGDLALAFGVMEREANAKGWPLADHTAHLMIHGVLHLIGYDHIIETEAEEMEALERRILARMGISDPYAAIPE